MQKLVLACLRFYHQQLSWVWGPMGVCRFTPTCSQYSYQAVEKYGILSGLFKSLVRLSKCHQWHPGGQTSV